MTKAKMHVHNRGMKMKKRKLMKNLFEGKKKAVLKLNT